MPTTRRRPTQEFEQTQAQLGQQIVTLDGLTGGQNSYTSPTLLSPQMWSACSNVYSGLFGSIRRARWAPILTSATSGYTPTTVRMTSMYGAYLPQLVAIFPRHWNNFGSQMNYMLRLVEMIPS